MRLFYYDTTGIKRILKENIGTIYYNEGYIQLTDFKPVSVEDGYGTLTIHATPETNIFSTTKNAILTLDLTDPSAINIRTETV